MLPKLQYHVEPNKGWLNDPNGLCYFQGKYHAFFQHNPHAPVWDTMHWGHAVSDDLIHWEELPIALYPDQPYESTLGCFSGSAVEKDGTLYLFYTAVGENKAQTQCLATTQDGIHFVKHSENPIIPQSPVDPNSILGSQSLPMDRRHIPYGLRRGPGWSHLRGAVQVCGSAPLGVCGQAV